MKITINVDCTPDEARDFFGLPDVKQFQQDMLAEMQKRMTDHMAAMNPDEMMKQWMPAGIQAMERMQEAFMAQMAQFSGGKDKKS
jgi:hypothetical protein